MTFWRCEPDLAGAVLLGEVGEVEHVVSTHPSDEHVQPDEVPAVILVVDADQVVALALAGVVGCTPRERRARRVRARSRRTPPEASRELCLRPTRRRGTSPARCTGPRGRRSRNSAESPPATSDTCSGGTQTSMSRASRGSLRASPPPTRTLKPTASSLSSPSPSPSIDLYAGSNARSLMSPCPEPSADPVTDTFHFRGGSRGRRFP